MPLARTQPVIKALSIPLLFADGQTGRPREPEAPPHFCVVGGNWEPLAPCLGGWGGTGRRVGNLLALRSPSWAPGGSGLPLWKGQCSRFAGPAPPSLLLTLVPGSCPAASVHVLAPRAARLRWPCSGQLPGRRALKQRGWLCPLHRGCRRDPGQQCGQAACEPQASLCVSSLPGTKVSLFCTILMDTPGPSGLSSVCAWGAGALHKARVPAASVCSALA